MGYYDYDVTHRLIRHVSLVCVLNSLSREVGSRLSALTGARLTILEESIEHRAGRSASEILSEEGLEGYRRAEAEELARIVTSAPPSVVVLGEGTLASQRNRAFVEQHTHLVHLRCGPKEVARHLERSPRRNVTFLLEAAAVPGSTEEQWEAIVGLRESEYRSARLVVAVGHDGGHRLARDLLNRLETAGALTPAP